MKDVAHEVVLVRRYIRVGMEETFLKVYGQQDPEGRPGFIDEKLYRLQDQDEPGVTKYINIAWWDSRADFERNFCVETPPKAEYEARQRERIWLSPVDTESIDHAPAN